jgi:hypothetical protein
LVIPPVSVAVADMVAVPEMVALAAGAVMVVAGAVWSLDGKISITDKFHL